MRRMNAAPVLTALDSNAALRLELVAAKVWNGLQRSKSAWNKHTSLRSAADRSKICAIFHPLFKGIPLPKKPLNTLNDAFLSLSQSFFIEQYAIWRICPYG